MCQNTTKKEAKEKRIQTEKSKRKAKRLLLQRDGDEVNVSHVAKYTTFNSKTRMLNQQQNKVPKKRRFELRNIPNTQGERERLSAPYSICKCLKVKCRMNVACCHRCGFWCLVLIFFFYFPFFVFIFRRVFFRLLLLLLMYLFCFLSQLFVIHQFLYSLNVF